MKLASLKHGRDGKLVVVSEDLSRAADASDIAPTLQYALDHWHNAESRLRQLASDVENGAAATFAFDTHICESPLPRAYQWADGSSFINHIELARKARGAELPTDVRTNPLMYQGGSDSFLGPHDDIAFPTEDCGIDFEGEIAVITGDVPMGVAASAAGDYIRLVMLVNDISLRYIAQAELGKGFGFFQGKPSTAFSPVAVTPDALGDAWRDNMLHRKISVTWNDALFGAPDAGTDYLFTFAELIAHAAKTRRLTAGTIIGSGTVSNYDRATGHACIIEKRMLEKIETGKAKTGFMRFGDTVTIDMKDDSGRSIFGAIRQKCAQQKN